MAAFLRVVSDLQQAAAGPAHALRVCVARSGATADASGELALGAAAAAAGTSAAPAAEQPPAAQEPVSGGLAAPVAASAADPEPAGFADAQLLAATPAARRPAPAAAQRQPEAPAAASGEGAEASGFAEAEPLEATRPGQKRYASTISLGVATAARGVLQRDMRAAAAAPAGERDAFSDAQPLQAARPARRDFGALPGGAAARAGAPAEAGAAPGGEGPGFAEAQPLESTRPSRRSAASMSAGAAAAARGALQAARPADPKADAAGEGSGFLEAEPLESTRPARRYAASMSAGAAAAARGALRQGPRPAGADPGAEASGFAEAEPLEATRPSRSRAAPKPAGAAAKAGGRDPGPHPGLAALRAAPAAAANGGGFSDAAPLESMRPSRPRPAAAGAAPAPPPRPLPAVSEAGGGPQGATSASAADDANWGEAVPLETLRPARQRPAPAATAAGRSPGGGAAAPGGGTPALALAATIRAARAGAGAARLAAGQGGLGAQPEPAPAGPQRDASQLGSGGPSRCADRAAGAGPGPAWASSCLHLSVPRPSAVKGIPAPMPGACTGACRASRTRGTPHDRWRLSRRSLPPATSRGSDSGWDDCEPLCRPVHRSVPHGSNIQASPFAVGPARAAAPEAVQACRPGARWCSSAVPCRRLPAIVCCVRLRQSVQAPSRSVGTKQACLGLRRGCTERARLRSAPVLAFSTATPVEVREARQGRGPLEQRAADPAERPPLMRWPRAAGRRPRRQVRRRSRRCPRPHPARRHVPVSATPAPAAALGPAAPAPARQRRSAGAPEPLGRRAPADSRPPLHSVGSGGAPGGLGGGTPGGVAGGNPRSPFVAGVVVAGMGDADDVSTGTPGTPSSSPSLNAEQARCWANPPFTLWAWLRVGMRQHAADPPPSFTPLFLSHIPSCSRLPAVPGPARHSAAGPRTPATALRAPGSPGSLPDPAPIPRARRRRRPGRRTATSACTS